MRCVNALERVDAFSVWLEDTMAGTIVPWEFGHALFNDRYPQRWDSNFLRVDLPLGDVDAPALASHADALMSAYGHRHIVVCDDHDGARVAPGFARLGWDAERIVYMALRRPPDRRPETSAEEVAYEGAEDLIERTKLESGMKGPEARELTRFSRELADRIGARFFVAREDGEPGAYCELYVHDGVAQIEDVHTVERFRGRGLARAVVCTAVEAAGAAGADLVFLCALEGDWPKELYTKLGFDPVGHFWGFIRRPRA